MGKDRRDLGVGERGQCAFADHNPATHTGQTVGKGLRDVQDPKVAGPRARLGKRTVAGHHVIRTG